MTGHGPLRVLFVEDNPDDAELIAAELARYGYDVAWDRCDSYAALDDAVTADLDVVLCDYSLPGMDPIDVLARIHATVPDLPIVVISGTVREDVAAALFRHGAADLLSKDRMARLGPAVKAASASRELARTARLATEREQLTANLLLGLLEHAPAAICFRGPDGETLVANGNHEALFASGPCDERDGAHAAGGQPPVDSAPLDPADVDAWPTARHAEVTLHGRSFLELSFPIAVDREQTAIGEILIDISHRKQIESELLAARSELEDQAHRLAVSNTELIEADRLKTDLVNTVSHELRTPLTSILGYSELLTDEVRHEPGSPSHRMIEMISRNSTRLLNLIDNLLMLAELDGVQPPRARDPRERVPLRVADLVETVTAVVLPTAIAAGLDLCTDVEAGVTVTTDDPGQLERVLLNLVSNAVKFSVPGGSVEIRARRAGDRVAIDVIDQGIGMAEHELARIGTRFFRGEQARERLVQGTGLGVCVVRSIVERHGGSLTYSSTPGQGTTASVLL